MLAEREKGLIEECSEWGNEYSALTRIISRLVKENESWKGKAIFACEAVINLTNELNNKESKLTALIEAAEPFTRMSVRE